MAELQTKILKLPGDWVETIDAARGEQSFSDFIRDAIVAKLGRAGKGLSQMPAWGQGRPKTKKSAKKRPPPKKSRAKESL